MIKRVLRLQKLIYFTLKNSKKKLEDILEAVINDESSKICKTFFNFMKFLFSCLLNTENMLINLLPTIYWLNYNFYLI